MVVRPAFPLSRSDGPVFVFDGDDKLLGTIMKPESLSDAVSAACADRQCVLRVQRVNSAEAKGDGIKWDVETDAGPRRFETDGQERSLMELQDGSVVLRTKDGDHYYFGSVVRMDERSRLEVEHYLPHFSLDESGGTNTGDGEPPDE